MNNLRPYMQHTPKLGERVMVDESAVVIGEVTLGDDVSIWPTAVIRGDVNWVKIGDRSNVQDGSVLHVTHSQGEGDPGYPLILGEDVTIGHKVVLHGCTIGNRVLVGMGAVVLDGVVVEDEVLIGAGSLVPPGKRLESGYLYYGNPLKQARPLTDAEREHFKYSSENYVRLKEQYL
ncbi:gamma carbonic anhydrase family protein [Dongshaea marina]|uniref:gamma carbonic anhydrase family protein n=1 Tax=Dongshaea marina TaxID=2047966 RepID=UPI000D3E2E58|nr:gamma carbonic anhydrase family protein [Dongshaea marina]